MSFFDKKEEVMEIQLTSYGKELLSKGRFKPFYYAFFDDGILYDGNRAGVTEVQNDIQDRIKNNTPYLRARADFMSPSDIVASKQLVPDELGLRTLSLFDFNSSFENQLGTSRNNQDNAPAWRMTFLQSTLTSSNIVLTSSANSRNLPIPQLNIDDSSVTYKTFIIDDQAVTIDGGKEVAVVDARKCEIQNILNTDVSLFPDGTRLGLEEKPILIKIKEENTLNLIDAYDFELFEVKDVTGSIKSETDKQVLRPLRFFNFKDQIQNGILLDSSNAFEDLKNIQKIDNTFASSYLEISVDGGADQEVLCRLDKEKKKDNIFIKDPKVCPVPEEQRAAVYDALGEGDISGFIETLGEDCE